MDLSFFSWNLLSKYVLSGFLFSVQLTIVSTLGGILFGTVLALMRLSGRQALVIPATIYVNQPHIPVPLDVDFPYPPRPTRPSAPRPPPTPGAVGGGGGRHRSSSSSSSG